MSSNYEMLLTITMSCVLVSVGGLASRGIRSLLSPEPPSDANQKPYPAKLDRALLTVYCTCGAFVVAMLLWCALDICIHGNASFALQPVPSDWQTPEWALRIAIFLSVREMAFGSMNLYRAAYKKPDR